MLSQFKRKIQKMKIFFNNRRESKNSHQFAKTLKQCGHELKVLGHITCFSPERIAIGDRCKLNERVILNGRSGINIGNDVTLSYGAMVLSTGYDLDKFMFSGKRVHLENQPVLIGDHCWICANAIILPGVKITGEYVVVAAGAVVNKDILESRVVVAGNPAKIVKRYEN